KMILRPDWYHVGQSGAMPTTLLLKTEAARLAAAQPWATQLLILVVFGVVVPLLKGLDFLDPLLLGAYTCMGAVFAPPAAASRFATPWSAADPRVCSGRTRASRADQGVRPTMAAAHARLAVCVAYGGRVALGMTVLG